MSRKKGFLREAEDVMMDVVQDFEIGTLDTRPAVPIDTNRSVDVIQTTPIQD